MIDIQALTAPIPGDSPAGEDLRYSAVYDTIKEARRADDALARGDWEREIKASDWRTVISSATEALSTQTKDLQIAAWLTEALVKTDGFRGFVSGLKVINELLEQYWDTVYPLAEDGDLEYRAGPFEFMNEKLWTSLKDVPVTDPDRTPGYSWLAWQDSRKVGTEKDILNQYGDVDESKRQARDALIAEGKLPAEEFDSAVAASSRAFYEELSADVSESMALFEKMDSLVDEKFGRDAPRLSELKGALADCEQLVSRILKEKRQSEPDAAPAPGNDAPAASYAGDAAAERAAARPQASSSSGASVMPAIFTQEQGAAEDLLWEDAIATLSRAGIREALDKLAIAANTAPSIRQKNRYRLLIAKLCLRVKRFDLARPIVEQLYAMIEELGLEKWESSEWIADVIDAYYQCLTSEEASDEDRYKARTELFQKLCTKDITKAFVYKG